MSRALATGLLLVVVTAPVWYSVIYQLGVLP